MSTNITDKIAKLTRHQRSAEEIGSIAEAKAFADKIAELKLIHGLPESSSVSLRKRLDTQA
jgi:hypothetical protein